MAAFPSIEPLGRSYDLGSHPISTETFNNGDETRFLHGSLAVAVPLQFAFPALTLADARLITGHWDTHGTIRLFTIPLELWRMHSNRYDVVPAGFLFRWAGPPEETPRSGGLFNVVFTLISVG
jgi:hypothetical protein